MKKLILSLGALFLYSCLLDASVSIIPVPQKCIEKKGSFILNKETVINLSIDDEGMRDAVAIWNDLLATAAGFKLEIAPPRSSNVIRCHINPSFPNEEAYKLKVTPSSIQIEAKTSRGVFYAFQTLRQLMPPAIEQADKVEEEFVWKVPCVIIEDMPSFSYRGIMLDVSRHFMPKEVVKRCIDLMAFHKLNTFHWHLTDDQGWRIEIKKYPKLTSVGGFRDKTITGHVRNKPYQWNMKRYGGFYTQEDVKEIVAYAKKRFVEIIPEIEMPGHSMAALAAYPEYSCTGGPFEVEGRWGVFNDIYCTKEATFEFMQNILDEVIPLFPSSYIHIGGDEVPRLRWKNCVHCQKRMKQERLTKESELQTYFINRVESYLNMRGKQIIGWDEILEGGIPQRVTVMSWRGEEGGIHAAKAGYDVIMTPYKSLYLNRYQLNPETEPLANGGFVPLEKVYEYYPVPSVLTPEEASHIIGVQGNMWTEYIASAEHLEYMFFPRTAALSEVAWSPKAKKNYDDFCLRLIDVEKHYNVMGLNYCKKIQLSPKSLMQDETLTPIPSEKPSKYQKQQISRKYGMFIHFGINTFHDVEWSDGSLPAESYSPLTIDARQWVSTAKKAGMKYIILVAKHHEGFCLWDSKYTEYDVANSGNPTNVIEEVALECKRQGIQLGLYYSLWDRKVNPDTENPADDASYNEYILNQLNELIDITEKHTKIVEFWFDGSWKKPSYRWPVKEIYETIKKREPQCQVGINWSIGQDVNPNDPNAPKKSFNIKPEEQKDGDPIRYFPSDFRLGDPLLPANPDPKVFTHQGKRYYMPFESTVCISKRWSYHTTDMEYKSADELETLYRRATAQDNILILNTPPNREGKIRPEDVNLLIELKERIKK